MYEIEHFALLGDFDVLGCLWSQRTLCLSLSKGVLAAHSLQHRVTEFGRIRSKIRKFAISVPCCICARTNTVNSGFFFLVRMSDISPSEARFWANCPYPCWACGHWVREGSRQAVGLAGPRTRLKRRRDAVCGQRSGRLGPHRGTCGPKAHALRYRQRA